MRVGLAAVILGLVAPAIAGPLDEARLCGAPARDAKGEILRRADVLRAFKQAHPCPAPDPARPNACPGWVMDHVIPLACGGCDAVSNLQWLPTPVWREKSLFERKVYGGHGVSAGCP